MTPDASTLAPQHLPPVASADRQDYYPLSPAQQRIFVMSHFKSADISNHQFVTYRVQGHVDIHRLEAAFRSLITRHESLRTSFHIMDDEPVQKIHDSIDFKLEYQQIPETAVTTHLTAFNQKFNPEQAPLFRAAILEINPEERRLLFNIHQLICDAYSLDILLRELWDFYHNTTPLPLTIQYKDYAVWQQSLLNSGALAEQEQFWLKQFSDGVPVTDLPFDFPRPLMQTFEGKDYYVDLHPATASLMLQDAHPDIFMLAVYNILLSKYTSQDDIVTGTGVSGRAPVGTAPVTGVFMNTLALRNYPKGDKSFEMFLQEVNENTIAARNHSDYPFEALVKTLHLQRDASRNPLVDTFFQYIITQKTAGHPGLQLSPFPTDNSIARSDLRLKVIQHNDQLQLQVNYNTALFSHDSVERLAKHYCHILSQVLENRAILLRAITLVDQAEIKHLQQFEGIPETGVPETTIPDLWKEQVALHKNRVAISTTDSQLTFEALDQQSTELAVYLQEVYHLQPGSKVAIMLKRTLQVPVTILAILKTGAAYVPIDPLFPAQRITYILTNSECSLIIADQAYKYDLPLFNIYGERKKIARTTLNEVKHNAADLAYIIYTSGSTGVPKGAMLEQRNVTGVVRNLVPVYGLTSTDKILAISNITFDLSVFEILCSLLGGVSVMLVKDDEINDFVKIKEIILQHKINVLQMTPSRLILFLTAVGIWVMEGIDILITGGEPLPKDLFDVLKACNGTRVFNSYGPTETGIYSTTDEIKDNKITIGKPLLNEQVFIISAEGHRQPVHVTGEIYIAGSGVGSGYCNQETLTAEKFIRNAQLAPGRIYKSGDMGRWLPDGRIECLGRKDNQVKVKGYRIELGEIENALMKMSGIKLAGVVLTPVNGENQIAAFYESDNPLEASNIRAFLAGYLPNYMLPLFCEHMTAIPLTSSGKVDRKSLQQAALTRQAFTRPYEAPAGSLQQSLAAIWGTILHSSQVSAADNFFEIGGNSIKLIQVLNAIKKELGVTVPLTTAFTHPTIRELAKKIEMIREFGNVSKEEFYSLVNPGRKQTIFCFPPAIGYSFIYTALGEHLRDYTICCFHFIEEDDRLEQYQEVMQEIAPEQPLIFLGYSSGGNLAFEVAKALEVKGQEVADIILIDSYRRCEAKSKPPALLEENIRAYFAVVDWSMFTVEPDYLENIKKITLDKISAYCKYMDGKMDDGCTNARMHILKSKEAWDTPEANRDWQTCAVSGFHTYEGSGMHMEMLNPEYLSQNAGLIATILQRSGKVALV